jgi:hypothetical protein
MGRKRYSDQQKEQLRKLYPYAKTKAEKDQIIAKELGNNPVNQFYKKMAELQLFKNQADATAEVAKQQAKDRAETALAQKAAAIERAAKARKDLRKTSNNGPLKTKRNAGPYFEEIDE